MSDGPRMCHIHGMLDLINVIAVDAGSESFVEIGLGNSGKLSRAVYLLIYRKDWPWLREQIDEAFGGLDIKEALVTTTKAKTTE